MFSLSFPVVMLMFVAQKCCAVLLERDHDRHPRVDSGDVHSSLSIVSKGKMIFVYFLLCRIINEYEVADLELALRENLQECI